jgi:hypothetical protein
MSAPITPHTKVAELLDAYPQLEDVLVRQSAHFKALKNQVLRKTVAKVATLEKAAQMSGVPVRRLVAVLREAAGLAPEEFATGGVASDVESPNILESPPDWVQADRVRASLDADKLLEAGEVPLVPVQQAARRLAAGELLRVVSTFRPTPLLEALEGHGFRTCVVRATPDTFHAYIARSAASSCENEV